MHQMPLLPGTAPGTRTCRSCGDATVAGAKECPRCGEVFDAPLVEHPPLSREQVRSRRKREIRARTFSVKRMTKRELELGRQLYPEDEHADVLRPRTRGDCTDGSVPRPCPFVSCKHHLYLDVSPTTGSIKYNFPDLEVHELKESCALDVADRHGTTLEAVAEVMNLTRERIRQIEVKGFALLQARPEIAELGDVYGMTATGAKRRLHVLQDQEHDDDEHEHADADADFDVDQFVSDELAAP